MEETTITPIPTDTTTDSSSTTSTVTVTVTPTVTPSGDSSVTPTVTPSGDSSVTPIVTPTVTVTPTITPTVTVTPAVTPTIDPSVTPGPVTLTVTPTGTVTIAATETTTKPQRFLSGFSKYFPYYSNVTSEEAINDLLYLQEYHYAHSTISPIVVYQDKIYYKAFVELLSTVPPVKYGYSIENMSQPSTFLYNTIDEAYNAAANVIFSDSSYTIGNTYNIYIYPNNYNSSSDLTSKTYTKEAETTTSQPSTTPQPVTFQSYPVISFEELNGSDNIFNVYIVTDDTTTRKYVDKAANIRINDYVYLDNNLLEYIEVICTNGDIYYFDYTNNIYNRLPSGKLTWGQFSNYVSSNQFRLYLQSPFTTQPPLTTEAPFTTQTPLATEAPQNTTSRYGFMWG